jgi:very-long-chain enoyl-CoA reductase
MVLSSFRKNKEKTDEYENASKKRGIPFGWGFGLVSCANYFWEALGWITFSILTRTWTAYFFTALSIYQMTEWALKKHSGYKK